MERLTKRDGLCGHEVNFVGEDDCFDVWSVPKKFMGAAIDRLAAYEDTGLEPEEIQKLAAAKKDGRLVVLPVPVGDGKMVYGLYDMEPLPVHIVGIDCDHLDGVEIYPTGEIVVEADGWEIGQSDIGETVFLTREEAEAALGGSTNEQTP